MSSALVICKHYIGEILVVLIQSHYSSKCLITDRCYSRSVLFIVCNLAGTHNSGAGAYGLMYWYSGAVAPSCYVRNQDKSITEQLELGIRYFDFDLAHVEESSGDWWEEGIVLVHCNGALGCAYSRSLRRALREVENFLGDNRDEVVLLRMKDHAEESRDYIRQHLAAEVLGIFQHSNKVRINRLSNPKLGEAIARNERLLIHTNGGFGLSSPFNNLRQIESYVETAGTSQCYGVGEVVDKLTRDPRIRYDDYPIQVRYKSGKPSNF